MFDVSVGIWVVTTDIFSVLSAGLVVVACAWLLALIKAFGEDKTDETNKCQAKTCEKKLGLEGTEDEAKCQAKETRDKDREKDNDYPTDPPPPPPNPNSVTGVTGPTVVLCGSFFSSATGKKFHKIDCRYLTGRMLPTPVTPVGKQPCRLCLPDLQGT